jgi:p-aminobenzoyl-glutamate transporter AbgT
MEPRHACDIGLLSVRVAIGMDDAVLLLMLAIAAHSYIEPDWKNNEPAAWMQVFTTSFALVFLGLYMIGRSVFH